MIALVAGQGIMPRLILEALHREGKPVLLLALKGAAESTIEELPSTHCYWLYPTQLGKALKLCKKHHATQILFAGRVVHQAIYALAWWRFDWFTIRTWLSLSDKRGDTILKTVARIMQKEGIDVLDSSTYLQNFVAPAGNLTGMTISSHLMKQLPFGIALVKELSRLNIGQTVVIKDSSVVALEAMEGTDQCLERAWQIAKEGCIVIKGAHQERDRRFDLPVIGPNTIEKLAKIQAALLVIEAGKTLILGESTLERALQLNIPILSLPF